MVPVPVSMVRKSLPHIQAAVAQQASSSSIPQPTTRFTPPINYKIRGQMPTHELKETEKDELLAQLEKDKLAPSTAVGRESQLRTWTIFHVRWFGTAKPILPLTVESIKAVAAQMKGAGYRTFPNYLVALKAKHCEHYAWTEELATCRHEVNLSTQRGIGPARQCMEIPVTRLAELQLDTEPLVPSGPICPMEWAVLSSFHILRGAESAVALEASVSINTATKTESWLLPVSKTDVQANGCLRSWGCVCKEVTCQKTCPYHAACRVKEELRRRFGDPSGQLPQGCPLFPDASGGWVSKRGFVLTIAEMASRLELPTTDLLERSALGEHVWRVSGSRHLAALDIPIPIIKLLARWGSDVVDRYVAEAPLSALTRLYVDRVQASDAVARGLVAAATSAPARDLSKLYHGADLESRAKMATAAASAVSRTKCPFVSSITGKVHLVSLPPTIGEYGTGRTPCGWLYGESVHQLTHELPADARCCERCGSQLTWGSVHALISQINCGLAGDYSDSE